MVPDVAVRLRSVSPMGMPVDVLVAAAMVIVMHRRTNVWLKSVVSVTPTRTEAAVGQRHYASMPMALINAWPV